MSTNDAPTSPPEPGLFADNLNESSPISGAKTNASANQQAPSTNNGEYNFIILKRKFQFDPLSFVFAVLVLAGGVIGYMSKGSIPSLVSGFFFFLAIGGAAYFEGLHRNPYPVMLTFLALGAMMSVRFVTKPGYPSGLITVLAFAMLGRHIFLVYRRRQNRSLAAGPGSVA